MCTTYIIIYRRQYRQHNAFGRSRLTMEQRTQSVELQERPTLYLIELSVYLFNPGTSPTLINPDFLRFNEIVEPSWRVVRPVIVEPDYCRIRYDNGTVNYCI